MKVIGFVQGFSIKVAKAKTLFFSNVHSRTRILYKSTHAGNHDMFAVLNFFMLELLGARFVLCSWSSVIPGCGVLTT